MFKRLHFLVKPPGLHHKRFKVYFDRAVETASRRSQLTKKEMSRSLHTLSPYGPTPEYASSLDIHLFFQNRFRHP